MPKDKNGSKTINCWVCGNNYYVKDFLLRQQNVNVIEKLGQSSMGVLQVLSVVVKKNAVIMSQLCFG